MYRVLQSVDEAEVIVFLRQEAPRRFSVGFRSASRVDVGRLAQTMGGGGHARAAGCTLTGTLGEVRRAVLAALRRQLASGRLSPASRPARARPAAATRRRADLRTAPRSTPWAPEL